MSPRPHPPKEGGVGPILQMGRVEAQVVKGWTEVAQAKNMEASFLLSHLLLWPTLCPSSLGLFLAREREREREFVCVCVCVF